MSELDKKTGTHALQPDEALPEGAGPRATGLLRSTLDYIPTPEPGKRNNNLEKPWRVALVSSTHHSHAPIGVELHGDVVLGRSVPGNNEGPDLDLSLFDAHQRGVSRRHAMLRPTARQLFLIDLRSTNGTLVNAVPQETGMARALKHNDTLSLGNLHLTIKIVERP